jgi:hypothetical protein
MASAYSVYTQEQPRSAAKPPAPGNGGRARRWLIRGGLTALLVLVLGAGVWGFVSYRHQRLLASLQKDPEKIRDAERAGKISRDEGRELFMNNREQRMDEQMDKYFSLPPGPQRTALLDKQIDEMQAQMRQWQSRAATRPTSRPTTGPTSRPNDRWGDPSQQMARVQGGNPARKAQRAEYRAAMQQRLAQRGITGPGGGRGGWGGGGGGRGGGGRGGR